MTISSIQIVVYFWIGPVPSFLHDFLWLSVSFFFVMNCWLQRKFFFFFITASHFCGLVFINLLTLSPDSEVLYLSSHTLLALIGCILGAISAYQWLRGSRQNQNSPMHLLSGISEFEQWRWKVRIIFRKDTKHSCSTAAATDNIWGRPLARGNVSPLFPSVRQWWKTRVLTETSVIALHCFHP